MTLTITPLIKSEIGRKVGKNIMVFLVMIMAMTGAVLADTSVNGTFALNLKEWLVLEIQAGGQRVFDRGQGATSIQTEIIPGQPVVVRALLAAGHGRTVVLRGNILSRDQNGVSLAGLSWSGEGDLSGRGVIALNQVETFAVWSGQGFKSGSLRFENSGEGDHGSYIAVFYLSAI